jgi:hypothetical protein
MRLAVLTVAYPARDIETYAHECFTSLEAQTDADFSVIVMNDGLVGLPDIVRGRALNVSVEDISGTPAAIRRVAIRGAIEQGFDALVFADIDDLFAENRVALSKQLLGQGEPLVCNELLLFGRGYERPRPMLGPRLNDGATITAADLDDANCMGMSNTAMRVDCIDPKLLDRTDDVVAFDWLFFTLFLRSGLTAKFTTATHTHYRQHAGNVATVRELSNDDILRGVRVKREHFAALSEDPYFHSRAKAFADMAVKLEGDTALTQRYCSAVRAHAPQNPLWWEPIKTLEELSL